MANRVGQGKYWICTIPEEKWNAPTELPAGIQFITGQREQGAAGLGFS